MSGTMRRALRAFSLIELMIVVVIMAILAAIVLPRYVDHSRRGQEAGLKQQLSQLRNAVATYQADTGFYPQALADLASTTAPAHGIDSSGATQNIDPTTWHGPYIGSVPLDNIAGAAFAYSTSAPNVGTVSSTA